jgi:[protein-PII] uridylyltransferase
VSEITTPSDLSGGLDAALASFRRRRAELLSADDVRRPGLVSALSDLTDSLLETVSSTVRWPPGWALLAVGGTGRRQLCPGSDIDLLLIHPEAAAPVEVTAIGEALWYPLWDVGLKVSPSTHSERSALVLADTDAITAVTWLDARYLAGDERAAGRFATVARRQWRRRATMLLPKLIAITDERHAKHGEVAFLLEPELRDGRGGLRDVHILRFVEQSGHPAVASALERPVSELAAAHDVLLTVRAELHRRTGRPGSRLLLQEQDGVADGLGYGSADELMANVSSAARAIAWCTGETLRRLSDALDKRFASRFGRPMRVAPNLYVQSGEIQLGVDADAAHDPTLILRTAATAALNRAAISRDTLRELAEHAPSMPTPWPDRARNALVALLGTGDDMLVVMEALDQYGLVERVLPEWRSVRSKPQRNAYHRYTVDRHLCQTAANAAGLVRMVARPDLLLIGSWLHDIGKGYPGDHTTVGVELLRAIGPRMGFPPDDVAVLIDMVRHHLLIPDAATRRDLSDPGTISYVAAAAGDVGRLQLLRALTEADSLATGATAWSDWKARLCDELVSRTADVLGGRRVPEPSPPEGRHGESLLATVRATGRLVLSVAADEEDCVSIAAPDRKGLFAIIAGSLSMHGVDVVSADVRTTGDGLAIDDIRVARRLGGATDWPQVEQTMNAALAGSLDLDAELERQTAAYTDSPSARHARHARHLAAEPAVLVSDDLQERATVVEVRAPDSLALLYRVTRALSRLNLDIRMAKVTTLGHEVVDAFSVVRVEPDGSRVKVGAGPAGEEIRRAILADLRARPDRA